MVWHHMFRSAMVIRFPRPAWQTGRAKKTAGTQTRGTVKTSLGLNDTQLKKSRKASATNKQTTSSPVPTTLKKRSDNYTNSVSLMFAKLFCMNKQYTTLTTRSR